MVMLVILVLGAATLLISSFSPFALKNTRQEGATAALMQARNALISFAITHGDTHPTPPASPNHVHGYLPCMDIDGRNLSNNPAEGQSDLNCGTEDVSMIGRFPWKTLGLQTLHDGDHECLWYAVSGTYKNNPKTSLMNWDTSGL
ncbi:MAG: hypothetical protein Q7S51_02830, partial [Gallionellaceae bacterium]|nr:hypothetical protein [Gallionellaceae bacterium]